MPLNERVTVIKGDITTVKTDAIVNAANASLAGGGGVDGAIHRKGGPEILKACLKIGGCATGEAVITTAGNLPAKYVIHTVGPVWCGGNHNEKDLLRNAYLNSLKLACTHNLDSVAIPNISTGIYGFPKKLAAEIALQAVAGFITSYDIPAEILFVCYDEDNFIIYNSLVEKLAQ